MSPIYVTSHDGLVVKLGEDVWRHIVTRHPELKGKIKEILSVVSNPDEVYVDDRGARHALKRSSVVSDYLVVIYEVGKGGGFIRTAYFISFKRKQRRYRWFKKLTPL